MTRCEKDRRVDHQWNVLYGSHIDDQKEEAEMFEDMSIEKRFEDFR